MAVSALALFGLAGPASSPIVAAHGGDEGAQLRELAERLLGQQYGYTGPGGQAASVQVVPGRIPPGLGIDFPLPPGGRVVGSLERLVGGELAGVQVVVDAPGSPQDAARFYESAFTARGWITPAFASGSGGGGFVPQSQPTVSAYYCENDQIDGAYVGLMATPLRTGWADVRLNAQRSTVGPPYSMGGTICSGPPSAPYGRAYNYPGGGSTPMPRLPALTAPEGVVLQTTGSGGGLNSTSTNAVAWTDLSPAQLAAHFEPQLAEAGWERVDGSASGPLAWSSWMVPGEGDWQGLFFAIELPGGGRSALSAWIASADQPGPGGSFNTMPASPMPSTPPLAPPPRVPSDTAPPSPDAP